jgi:hypothetical protein
MFSACVPHDLESPESIPIANGKADGNSPETLKDEIIRAIWKKESCYFHDNFIPAQSVWENINYKSFDYKKFFFSACPLSGQIATGAWMACEYVAASTKRVFYISEYPDKVIVEIKEIGFSNNIRNAKISGIWEITGTAQNFTVKKYEKITDNGYAEYNVITASYNGAKRTIVGEGASAMAISGYYEFRTRDVGYTSCENVPGGIMEITGANEAELLFFFSIPKCNDCVPTTIDGGYGKFSYCGPWLLRDLFDYLTPFLS